MVAQCQQPKLKHTECKPEKNQEEGPLHKKHFLSIAEIVFCVTSMR